MYTSHMLLDIGTGILLAGLVAKLFGITISPAFVVAGIVSSLLMDTVDCRARCTLPLLPMIARTERQC